MNLTIECNTWEDTAVSTLLITPTALSINLFRIINFYLILCIFVLLLQ
jgi:hypothetical protein